MQPGGHPPVSLVDYGNKSMSLSNNNSNDKLEDGTSNVQGESRTLVQNTSGTTASRRKWIVLVVLVVLLVAGVVGWRVLEKKDKDNDLSQQAASNPAIPALPNVPSSIPSSTPSFGPSIPPIVPPPATQPTIIPTPPLVSHDQAPPTMLPQGKEETRVYFSRSELDRAVDAYLAAPTAEQGIGIHKMSTWKVGRITNFDSLFAVDRNPAAVSFNDPDINQWDLGSATSVRYLFDGRYCSSNDSCNIAPTQFNQPLDRWNMSSVRHFGWMFERTANFSQDLSNWDVSSGTGFDGMFQNAVAYNQDLSTWDVARATSFREMFDGATSFNQDLSKWDVSGSSSFRYMFNNAARFNQDLSTWNVSGSTNFYAMFLGASSFNHSLCSWDLSLATSIDYMFSDTSCPVSLWSAPGPPLAACYNCTACETGN